MRILRTLCADDSWYTKNCSFIILLCEVNLLCEKLKTCFTAARWFACLGRDSKVWHCSKVLLICAEYFISLLCTETEVIVSIPGVNLWSFQRNRDELKADNR